MITPYNPMDALTSDDAIEEFLKDAFESADAGYIAHTLRMIVEAKGYKGALYRSIAEDGNPTLKTVLAVMQSLGFELMAKRHSA